MKYSYCRFPDNTEITYGDIDKNGNVLVRVETPVDGGFNSFGCILPTYQVTERVGYTQSDVNNLLDFLRNNAHLIIEFAIAGGFDNATAL